MKREVAVLALLGLIGAVVGGLLQLGLSPHDRSVASGVRAAPSIAPAQEPAQPDTRGEAGGEAGEDAEFDPSGRADQRSADAPSGRDWEADPPPATPSSRRAEDHPPRSSTPFATPSGAPVTGPARLEIPSLGVSAPLVATTWQGRELRVPRRPSTVGLVDGRLRAHGANVITGHVSVGATPGALHPLHRLQPGARIDLIGADGRVRVWRATRMQQLPRNRVPTDLRSSDGAPHLVLVTCAGRVRTEGGRRVFADLLLVTATPA